MVPIDTRRDPNVCVFQVMTLKNFTFFFFFYIYMRSLLIRREFVLFLSCQMYFLGIFNKTNQCE